MKKLVLTSSGGTVLEFPIEDGQTNLELELESHIVAVDANPILYDPEATAIVTGDGYIENDDYTISIRVSEPHSEETNYEVHIKRINVGGYDKDVHYSGRVETLVVPYSHDYLLEVWGAQGGNNGGKGGYSYGTIYLEAGTKLYLYAGGSGASGGFNGGGSSKIGYGGGASDIRIGTDSLYSRVIVAGGGGGHGSDGCAVGGVGGGLRGGGGVNSGSCGTQAGSGTQTEGGNGGIYGSAIGRVGDFGIGASAATVGGSYYGGGGGGGWYGGGSGSTSGWSNGGGGGSGFIYTAEYASSIEGNRSWLLDSSYYLENAETLMGSDTFTSPAGQNETGHTGNGFVRVSIPYSPSENNFLKGIISNKGVMTPDWDYNVDTYYLELPSNETKITLEAIPEDNNAIVTGNGEYTIEAGTTEIPFTVMAENGYIKNYTVVVHRPADSNGYPDNISINGLIESICQGLEGACEYQFDKNTNEYNVTVPYNIREIELYVDKGHEFQTVTGDGIYELNGGNNDMIVTVTSEDKTNETTYTYHIYRDMNNNADLKSLKIIDPEYTLNYSYNITDYYITVPNEIEHIEIEALPDDEEASVKIDNPEVLEK